MPMDMWNAPSDRDYADYLNPHEPEGEDPAVMTQACCDGRHGACGDVDANCCECNCHLGLQSRELPDGSSDETEQWEEEEVCPF